MLLVTA